MSNAIFPQLPGQTIDVSRAPSFLTKVQKAVSGKETRSAFMAYPMWNLAVKFEFLRDGSRGADLQTIEGLFLQMRGAWDSFLVLAPSDSTVSDMPFGTGNGLSTSFQLTRTRGAGGFGFTEPCQNIASLSAVKAAGSVVSPAAYSVDGSGRITFSTPPASSASLTWSGSFYYRCRFLKDEAQFEKFLHDLWKLGQVEMIGAPGNKV